MRTRTALSLAVLWLAAGPAAAAGMKLERERLFTTEGPGTVGFLKRRFDFQHNFKDFTLNPAVDLTLILGVWDTIQVEGEALLHNEMVSTFNATAVRQYDTLETAVKWAILDQSKEDWFSLAVAGMIGRTDLKAVLKDPAFGIDGLSRHHFRNLGAYALVHYDTRWVTPSFQVTYDRYAIDRNGPSHALTTPGLGLRLKVWETRDAKVHLVGDYQLASFALPGFHRAWGAGTQMMVGSPHVFSFFLSNTAGDTLPDVVVGVHETYYNFRCSYRF